MKEILKGIKALADENRLKIIKLLLKKNYCVGALSRQLEVSESAVSQQLKILRKSGLVMGEKKGYYVHYRVKAERLKEIGDYIIELGKNDRVNNNCCHENNDSTDKFS